MKSRRFIVAAGVIAVVSLYFAADVFAAEGPIVSPYISGVMDITKGEQPLFPETFYPACSPDTNPKLDKGATFIAGDTCCPAVSPCK